MGIFEIALILAVLLCSLSAGFLLAFAIVVMPGIKALNDRAFLRSFQVMDRVIQNNQPIFLFVWIGSVVALLTSAVLGLARLDGLDRALIILAAVLYVFGVQMPTIGINVPLNNKLKRLDVDAADDVTLRTGRDEFELRWNTWNAIRTGASALASLLLIILLLRI